MAVGRSGLGLFQPQRAQRTQGREFGKGMIFTRVVRPSESVFIRVHLWFSSSLRFSACLCVTAFKNLPSWVCLRLCDKQMGREELLAAGLLLTR